LQKPNETIHFCFTLKAIDMNFQLTDDQLAFQAMAQQFAAEELAPYAKEWDEASFFPIDTLRKAAALGFAGIYIRDDLGGTNLNRLDAAIIFEALSAGCVSTAAYLSIHNMAAAIIDQYGNDAQRQQWLPSLLSMAHLSSYCLTEPSAGSDAASLKTSAIREGDHYILNGAKAFISGGSVSDIYVCMVRTGEAGPKGISCVIVEKGTPGLSFGKKESKLGWNSQPTTMVFFENCRIPVTNRIGAEGEGFKIALNALNGGRLNIGACSLGGAYACLRLAKNYMTERRQFGKSLADFQALQFKIADMATELEAARLMIYNAAHKFDTKDSETALYCAMAKRFATDIGFNICNNALQIYGGYGYLKEYPIERYVRDLRVHQILEGTNEIMRTIITKRIFSENFNLF
jgi:alkylation response protein AidB-like acyl-CoA dehydrogenase